MKRIITACLEQTIKFEAEEELEAYKAQLDRKDIILIFNQPIDKSSAEIITFVVKLPCKAASLAAVAFLDCDYFICRLCL